MIYNIYILYLNISKYKYVLYITNKNVYTMCHLLYYVSECLM